MVNTQFIVTIYNSRDYFKQFLMNKNVTQKYVSIKFDVKKKLFN